MKKIESETTLLPDYGRKKLLTYADSFRDLASTFMYLPTEGERTEEEDRQDYLLQKRLTENRGLLADHLNEMAQIMTRVAQESFCVFKPSERQLKQLNVTLKEQGIALKDIYMIDRKSQHMEITASLKAIRQTTFSMEEIAGLFSVVFNKRMMPTIGSPSYLNKETQTVTFEEESRFGVLTGIARAIKETERVSGDNYSFTHVGNSKLLTCLSDGMGTGEKACRDSEEVIELLEKLLEAGFSKETAVQIINGVLIAGSERENMSTLDVCDMDLYTGMCEFLKAGSSLTFLKKAAFVESISATTLPLGVFAKMDTEIFYRKVSDGDYIIMLSDGIMDAIPSESNLEIVREMIEKIKIQNPKEIANYILNFAIHAGRGKIGDDMTVLVIGVWENNL